MMRRTLNVILVSALLLISCEKEPIAPEVPEVVEKLPQVSIVSPTPGQTVTGPINIEVEVDHDTSIVLVDFFVDNVHIGSDSTKPYSYRWNAGFHADGSNHTILVKATDELQKVGESEKISIVVDTSASAFRIITPSHNALLNGSVTIRLDTTDAGALQSVDFYVDNDLLGTSTVKPFTQYWYAGFWADGLAHTLKAVGIDSSGNVGMSQLVSVMVSGLAGASPIVVGPTNNQYQENLQVQFSWKSIPTATEYEVEASEFPGSVDFTVTTTDSSAGWTTPYPSLYAWRVRAKNKFGRYTAWSSSAEFATIVTFSRNVGAGFVSSVKELSTEGYVAVGPFSPVSGGSQGRIVRLNKLGQTVWEEIKPMWPSRVVETVDRDFILIGTNTTQNGAAALKLNSAGQEVWSKEYTPYHGQSFKDIVQNDDGSITVSGSVALDPAIMSTTSWLCRLSSNGDTLWTRVYPGKDELAFEAMNRSIDGALLLAGWSYDRPEPMVNDSIVSWVCKLDQNLDTLWYKEFKPATFTFFETMSVGPSGEILLGGRYGDAQSVTWLTKLDPNGDLLWSKTYSQAEIYPIGSISPTNNGGYVLTGRSQGLFIMTIDGSGNQILYKKYIEGSSGYSIIQTADQGFLVGGNTSEMWLLKTDRHGRVQYTD